MPYAARIHQRLCWFLRDEEGAAASEYAVMLALLAVIVVVAIAVIGYGVAETGHLVTGVLPGGGEGQLSGPLAATQSVVITVIP